MQPHHLNYNNNKRLTEWEAEIERIREAWIHIAIDLITLELSQKRLCRNTNHFDFFIVFSRLFIVDIVSSAVCKTTVARFSWRHHCMQLRVHVKLVSELDALPIKICSTALCLDVMYFLSISPIILAVI